MLELRNPHSVLATLDVRPRAVRSVLLNKPATGTPWDDVAAAAQRHAVPVRVGRSQREPGRRHRETERTGAGSAQVEPPSPVPLENLWKPLPGDSQKQVWLALDQVQDPQNLGAIFRLAGFFGIGGIVLTRNKSASVNSTVCDVACGGVEYVPFSVVSNLTHAIRKAKEQGIWVLGTCERSDTDLRTVDRKRPWLLVMGNEGQGLRRLTRENCDVLAALPARGQVPSLNVAAATAACLTVLTGE